MRSRSSRRETDVQIKQGRGGAVHGGMCVPGWDAMLLGSFSETSPPVGLCLVCITSAYSGLPKVPWRYNCYRKSVLGLDRVKNVCLLL